jgi:hypothetical protein
MRNRRRYDSSQSYTDGDRFPADARPVGDWVDRVVGKWNLADKNWFEQLAREWPQLAGMPVSKHARPGRFAQATVYLFVDSSPWLFEIRTKYLPGLAARLKTRFPAIREIRLELNPERT